MQGTTHRTSEETVDVDQAVHLHSTRSARLATEHVYSPITSLDGDAMDEEHIKTANEQVGRYMERRGIERPGSAKLQKAKTYEHKSEQDLRSMCLGLEEELRSIGYEVTDAYQFKGTEKVWAFFGNLGFKSATERAIHGRLHRLETQTIAESVKEIGKRSLMTIKELGLVQKDYEANIGSEQSRTGYKFDLANTIAKYRSSQPIYEKAKAERVALEAEIDQGQQEIDSGQISEADRPEQEAKLRDLRDKLEVAKRTETEHFEIVRVAQQSIPEIQKSLKAAQEAVQALVQMRRSLLEKTENFKSVFENAMTAVKAKAKLEAYQAVDPAFNVATTQITENNVKTAVAALEIALQRAAKAAISPEDSARLLNELLSGINNYMMGMADLQEQAATGNFTNNAKNEEFDDVVDTKDK